MGNSGPPCDVCQGRKLLAGVGRERTGLQALAKLAAISEMREFSEFRTATITGNKARPLGKVKCVAMML